MSNREEKPSERYYVAYQRSMAIGLVFVVCLGIYYMVAVVLGPAGGPRLPWGLLIVAAYLVLLSIVLRVTLRGRAWHPRGQAERAVMNDEWTRSNRGRAYQVAFWVMFGVQLPMMFVMADLPSRPERGVVGMGMMTCMVGLGTYFAAYLYYSRQPTDE